MTELSLSVSHTPSNRPSPPQVAAMTTMMMVIVVAAVVVSSSFLLNVNHGHAEMWVPYDMDRKYDDEACFC